jgi:hypothetical protein
MKYILILITAMILVSCSGNKFTRRVHKSVNTEELVQFREYLLKKNVMDSFKEYTILGSEDDSIVRKFFQKYDIHLMYIRPCFKNGESQEPTLFKNCGNMIDFRYNGLYFIEANHSLIFDYSEGGLELHDGTNLRRHKIAEGIFVF